MNPGDAAAALLKLVADKRKARCDDLRERAASEARAILKQAHADARKRVRAALEEARKRGAERVARAEAQRRTRERLARQHELKALLARGWERVGAALDRSWGNPEERRQWVERSVLRAAEVLPAGHWRIAHPAAWPVEEQERPRQLLEERGLGAVQFTGDTGITAGIKVASGNGVFDATLGGLLSDRAVIEARLLFHLEGVAA